MGNQSTVIGYISEVYHCWPTATLMEKENRLTVSKLPNVDKWPPINKGLFSFSGKDGIDGGYDYSIIHFGGSYKDIYLEWNEWLEKFESFLRTLYWQDAWVRIDGICGSHEYEWCVSEKEMNRLMNHKSLTELPLAVEEWSFKGGHRTFV